MTDETLRGFIARRRRELQNQLTAARGSVASIEFQLTELDRAEKILPPTNELDNIPPRNSNALVDVPFPGVAPFRVQLGQQTSESFANSFATLTIKQLVMLALRAKHPEGFATTALREFIRDAYGRAIEPDSLRPQLLRLKADDWIVARSDAWHLTKKALTYTHARSMNINDEPSDDELAQEIKAMGKEGQISITHWRHHRPTARQERWYGKGPKKE